MSFLLDQWLQSWLAEDLGRGDVTSRLTVGASTSAEGTILAKSPLILAGTVAAERVFTLLDETSEVSFNHPDGTALAAGEVIGQVRGRARALLAGERLALNLLQHLSGVATLTRTYVEAVGAHKARVLDTRKTLPGLRQLEKEAVRAGGGHNHRAALDDGILIKDNHIVLAGGLDAAIAKALAQRPHNLRIEVEVGTSEEARRAVEAGAEMLLLDNMTPEQIGEIVSWVDGKIPLEASGGVNLDTIGALAATGVDFISVGRLTHSVQAADINLKFKVLR
jgi:nicotinate-nucleotide pyrophosphorylase (carboxylating)